MTTTSTNISTTAEAYVPLAGSRQVRARLFVGSDGVPDTLEITIGHIDPFRPDGHLELPGSALSALRAALASLAVSAADHHAQEDAR
jgi:hypothetical protein